MTRTLRWKPLAGGLLAVAALAVGAVVIVRPAAPEPADVVRAYLEAIRARDVDRALELAGAERPSGERGRFLVPEAVGDDWTMPEIRSHHLTDEGNAASVSIKITGSDAYLEDFELRRDEAAGWRIEEPFAEVSVESNVLRYFDVNGVTAPVPNREERTYLLFPGSYPLYPSATELVDLQPKRLTLGPGGTYGVELTRLALTEAGARAVESATRTFLDQCMRMERNAAECPLTIDSLVRTTDGHVENVTDLAWTVVSYPSSPLAVSPLGIVYGYDDSGRLLLTGTGTDQSGARVSFSTECRISFVAFDVGINADGTMSLTAPADPSEPSCGKEGG